MKVTLKKVTGYEVIDASGKVHPGFLRKETWNGMTELRSSQGVLVVQGLESVGSFQAFFGAFAEEGEEKEVEVMAAAPDIALYLKLAEKQAKEKLSESWLGELVTAKLKEKDACRQGVVVSVNPLVVRGAAGEYLCEGVPTLVNGKASAEEVSPAQQQLQWMIRYIKEEDFPEKHLKALSHIVGLFNDCEESEQEIFDFAKALHEKYAG